MVAHVIVCPHCQQTQPVIRHGVNRSGTPRCRCKDCNRAFTLAPRSRRLAPDKEQTVLRALQEKTPVIAICRTLISHKRERVSPKTVYALLKKT